MTSAPLIGIIGPFGPAQLACLRSWRRAGYRTAFFQLGGRRVPAQLQGLADAYRFYPATMPMTDVISEVSNTCELLQVAGVASLAESLALKLHAAKDAGAFRATALMLNSPDVYELIESKLRQAQMASDAGLPVMPTFPVDSASTAIDSEGPLVLRPDIARLVRPMFKAELVNSPGEALKFVARLTSSTAKVIAQPFVEGPNLIIHAARAADGSWDHHEGFVTEIKHKGLAVSLQPYPISPELLQACRNFEQTAGLRGVFHYDFILGKDSRQPYFLEVNPRLGGTTAKVYAAGYDEPSLLVAAFLQSGMHNIDLGRKRSAAISRVAALKCASAVLVRPPSLLDHPSSGRTGVFGRMLKALAFYPDEVFSLTDITGNCAYLMQARS
jgi:hypothetical protein